MHISVLHMHRLVIFQNQAHIQNLERLHGECKQIEMSALLCNARNHHRVLVPVNQSFLLHQCYLTTSTSLQMLPVCFVLCKKANVIVCLFDSLCPINNLSVKQEQVFLG